MSTTLNFAARLNIQADGTAKVQSQIDGLEKDLVEAVSAGDKATQNWIKSMITVAKMTKEVVASLEKVGSAGITFDPTFLNTFQSGIQRAVEQGVINGMNAGKKAVQNASVSGQTATQSPSATADDSKATLHLTASITRLDQSIINFANALNRQNSLAGGNVRNSVAQATGRPQFDIFQEVSEVSLREQGKQLRNVATEVVNFMGDAERVINDKKLDIRKMVQELNTKLDINTLTNELGLETFDLGDSLGSQQADLIAGELFSSIKQKFSVQLLSDTDSLFNVLHQGFLNLKAQGYKGASVLKDEQGKWFSETEAGQRLMATIASRFFQSMKGAPNAAQNPRLFQATTSIKGPEEGPFNLQTDFVDKLEGVGADDAKAVLATVMQLFQAYEQIEDTKTQIAELEKQTKDNASGALQNLERMLALNRDHFALAKQNNAISARYTNILQQNNALLAKAPDAVSYGILEGDLTTLIALQREYSHQVQRSTNLNKDLEVQANRQRNLSQAYSKDLRTDLSATIDRYIQLGGAISSTTAKIIAQDAATKAGGGAAQFDFVVDNIKAAASGIENIVGGDSKNLIDSMLGGNFNGQMAARLKNALMSGVAASAADADVAQQFVPLIQKLAAGMQQLAGGASGIEGVSEAEAKELMDVADALKLVADRSVEAANNQAKFKEAAKQTVNQQVLLEQQTTAVAKILQTLRSETRISEEGLRIVEKQLRRLASIDFKFKANLVDKDTETGLTKVESAIDRIRSIGGIFDQNAIDEVKNQSRALKDLRDQLQGAKYDIEAARASQVSRIADEASKARRGDADSEFSGIAPENLEVEVANRLKAVNTRFDEMRDKIVSDLDIAEKAVVDFTEKTKPLVRQGQLISNAYNGVQEISLKMQNLTMQAGKLAQTKIRDSLDLSIVAGQYKQLGQDIDTASRKNRELRAEMTQIANELNLARGRAEGFGGATAEDIINMQMLNDKYEQLNKELLYSEQLEKRLINQKNSAIAQETILAAKRLDAARQIASSTREFDVADAGSSIAQLSKDLKSLNVDVLARASNDFKNLRSQVSSALQQAQKSLSTFQAQQKNGTPLSADDQANVDMLQQRIPQLKDIQDQLGKMEGAAKSADSRLKQQTQTFQEYGQQLQTMIRGQVDFAIGTGVITAGFAALGTAFREVLSESRALSRAITVLQSNLLTTAQITDFTYEKTRKLAVQYGMTVGAVADIAKELGSAGFKLQEVSRGWEATLRAINATNADATTVTRAVSGIYAVYRDQLKAAGQEAQAFNIITNTLTSIFQNHQAEMDEIVQGYKFVVGTGKTAGFTFQQMGAYLAVLNDNMIKSGMAGRSLQVVFAQMAAKTTEISEAFNINLDPSKTVAQQFNQVLDQMYQRIGDAEVSAGELNKIFKIFDKQGARAFATLVQQYPSVKKALNELEFGAEGVTAKMNDIINSSLDRKFYQMKQAALDFAREGLDSIKPILIGILETFKAFFRMINDINKMTNGLASASVAFIGLSFAIYKSVYALTALSAVAGGSFIKSMGTTVLYAASSFATLTNKIWAAGAAMIAFTKAGSAPAVSRAGAEAAVEGILKRMLTAAKGFGKALAPALIILGKAVLIIAAISAALYAIEKIVEKISGGFSVFDTISGSIKSLWDSTGGAIYDAYTRVDRLTESLDKSRAELARLRKEAADFKSIMELTPSLLTKIQSGGIGADVGADQIQTMIRDAGGDVSLRFMDVLSMSAEEFGSRLRDDLLWAADFRKRMESESAAFQMSNIKKQRAEREKELKTLVDKTAAETGAGVSGLKDASTTRLAVRFSTADARLVDTKGRIKSIEELEAAYNKAFAASKNYDKLVLKSLSARARADALKEIGDTQFYADSILAIKELKKEANKANSSVENLLTQKSSQFKETFIQITGLMAGMGMTIEQMRANSGMKTLLEVMFPNDPAAQEAAIKKLLNQTATVIKRNANLLNPDTSANLVSMQQPISDMVKKFNYQGSPSDTKNMFDFVFDANVTLETNKQQLIDAIEYMREGSIEDTLADVNTNPIMAEIPVDAAVVMAQNTASGINEIYFNTEATEDQIKMMEKYFRTVNEGSAEIEPTLRKAQRIRNELMKGDMLTPDQRKELIDEGKELANLIVRAGLDPEGYDKIIQQAVAKSVKALDHLEKIKGRVFEGLNKDVVRVNVGSLIAGSEATGRSTEGAAAKIAESANEVGLAKLLVDLEKQKDNLLKGNAGRIAETNSLMRKQYDLNSIISKRTAAITTSVMKLRDTMKNVNFETAKLQGLKEEILKLDSKSTQAQMVAAQMALKQELARFSIISDTQLAGMRADQEVEGSDGAKLTAGSLKAQRDMMEQINEMLLEKQGYDAEAIKKGREISFQIENEKNIYQEKLNLMLKEIFVLSDLSAGQMRLSTIHQERVDGMIREMKINRELVDVQKFQLTNAKELADFISIQADRYDKAAEAFSNMSNKGSDAAKALKGEMAAITVFARKNAGGMQKLIDAQITSIKNYRALLQKIADENTMAIQTLGAASSIIVGTDTKGGKLLNNLYSQISKLPQLNLNSKQIVDVQANFSTSTGDAGAQFTFESDMIMLLDRRVKLIKDLNDLNKETMKLIREQLIDDKRPELYKEIAESYKRVRDMMNEETEARFDVAFGKDSIATAMEISRETGADFFWVIQNQKEAVKDLVREIEEGRSSLSNLSSTVAQTLAPQVEAYRQMISFEKKLMKAQLDRVDKMGKVLTGQIERGEFSAANSSFSNIQSSVLDAVKKSGNEKAVQEVSLQLIKINGLMLDLEKHQGDRMLVKLDLTNALLMELNDQYRQEANKIIETHPFVKTDLTIEQIADSLEGNASFRSEAIEEYQIAAQEQLTNAIIANTVAQKRFGDMLKAMAMVEARDAGKTIEADTAEEQKKNRRALDINVATKIFEARKVNGEPTESQVSKMIAANKLVEESNLEGAKAVSDAVAELQRMGDAATDTITSVETLKARLADFRKQGKDVDAEIQKLGASLLDVYAANNPLWNQLRDLPNIMAGIVSASMSIVTNLGNLDYAVQNAEAFQNYLVKIGDITNEYAKSIEEVTLGLRRNESDYYDYINSVADADKKRAEELLAAQEEYRNSLAKTRDILVNSFILPSMQNVGAGLESGLSSLASSASSMFTEGLNSISFLQKYLGGDSGPQTKDLKEATDAAAKATDVAAKATEENTKALKALTETMKSTSKSSSGSSSGIMSLLPESLQGLFGQAQSSSGSAPSPSSGIMSLLPESLQGLVKNAQTAQTANAVSMTASIVNISAQKAVMDSTPGGVAAGVVGATAGANGDPAVGFSAIIKSFLGPAAPGDAVGDVVGSAGSGITPGGGIAAAALGGAASAAPGVKGSTPILDTIASMSRGWESFKNFAGTLKSSDKKDEEGGIEIASFLTKNLSKLLIGGVGGLLSTAVSGFGSIIGQTFSAALSGNADKLLEYIKRFASEIPAMAAGIVQGFMEVFPELIDTIVSDVLPSLMTVLVEQGPQLITSILDTFIKQFPRFITVMVKGLTKAIGPLTDALLTGIAELVPTLISTLPEILGGIQSAILSVAVSLLKNLPKLIVMALVSVLSLIMLPIDMVLSLISNTLGKLLGFKIPSLVKAFASAGAKLVSKIPTFHTGGVVGGSGEQPAILLGGEGVLNKKAMSMLGTQNLDMLNKGQLPQMRQIDTIRANRDYGRPVANTTNMGGLTINVNGVRDAEIVPNLVVDEIERRLVKKKQNRSSKL
jgi:hypothetical protein